jgi:hypothetical protein
MPCRSLNYIPENCSPGSCQSPYPYRCSFQSCSFQRCGRARLTHLARRHTAMEAHHVSRLGSVRGRCGRQDQWRNCGAAGPGGWPPGSRGYYLGRHSPRGQGRRQISVCDSAWRMTASLNRPGGNVTGVSAMNVELTTARQPKTVGQVKSGQLLSPRIVELTRDEASSFRVPAGTKDDRKRRGFDRECRWHAARCDNNGDPAADHSTPGK